MIKSIQIKNFQSHKDTTLKLDPGVNIIVGQSDSGKTAILRALRWLIWNKPGGNAFRSEWGGDTVVEVNLDSMEVIQRKKTKSNNTYEYSPSPRFAETIYRSFGQGVPEDITRALNISDINVQGQLDAPFLLSETSGEIAKKLNKIANIDNIDKALSNINKKSRETNTRVGIYKEDLEAYKKDKESLVYIEDAEKEVNAIAEKDKYTDSLLIGASELALIIVSLKQSVKSINNLKPIVKAEKDIKQLIEKQEHLEVIDEKAEDLENIILKCREVVGLLKGLKPIVKAEKDIDRYIALSEGIKQRTAQYKALDGVINNLKHTKFDLLHKENALEVLEKEFHNQIGEICPLCNQKIK